MSYPIWWNQTITLYHHRYVDGVKTWARKTYSGCFVQRRETSASSDTARRDGNRVICRIPMPTPVISLGDIIFAGTMRIEIDEYIQGMTSAEFLAHNADRAFTVTEIHDNTADAVPVRHVYVGGA